MVFHDYLAEKIVEIQVVIEDLESVAETPGDLEALMRLTELRDRLEAAREQYQRESLLYF